MADSGTGMDEDRFIPGMAELVEAIHKYGCPTFMQMEHDGPWQSPLFDNAPPIFEGAPIAASPVNIPKLGDFHRDMPRQLTVPEIETIIRKIRRRRGEGKEGGLRRHRHKRGEQPYHTQLPLPLLEQAR